MKVPENLTHVRLPDWVKCMYCGEKPKQADWLVEVIPHSSALAHQSCLKQRGQVAGMNVGTVQILDNKIQALQGD